MIYYKLKSEKMHLFTDLDGTLLGDNCALERFSRFAASNPTIATSYVTGRCVVEVLGLIESGYLPPPTYIGSEIGTQLFDFREYHDISAGYIGNGPDNWVLDEIYARGDTIETPRYNFVGRHPLFHASFYWDGDKGSKGRFMNRLSELKNVDICFSAGRYIDVLPKGLGKGSLVVYVQKLLGLDLNSIVVCGDSGNDVSMFQIGAVGIIPANADMELLSSVDSRVHILTQSTYASGVLEGLSALLLRRMTSIVR